MGRWLRERLTWKLFGLTIAFVVAAFWVMGRDIQIGVQAFDPEATGTFLLAGVALLWYIIPALSHWADKPIFGSSSSTIQKEAKSNADRNRADLLEAVDQIWLKGLLDNLLNQDKDFQIKLAFLEPEKVAQQYGGEPYPLKDNRAVLQTFEDFGRRLVLLGEPGAGKTVLLLQLARALHQIALDNKTAGIPVIFPLSSWAQKQLPFDEWLRGELRDRYGASPKLAETLVAGERLIYLLDGLDEVNADQREACLKTLKVFVEDPNRRIDYVLCSRRTEFAALETRLGVPGEIVLQPLSWEAIQQYIQGDEFATLRTLLNENAILREDFARIPFMLNTMAYVTQGDSIEKARLALVGKTDEESLRANFLDAFMTKRLREKSNVKYPADKTRHWLSWLAGQLIREDQTDLYLENMQFQWIATKSKSFGQSWFSAFGIFIIIGFIIGFLISPLIDAGSTLNVRVFTGVSGSIIGGITGGGLLEIFSSVISRFTSIIRIQDVHGWSMTLISLRLPIGIGIIFGLLASIRNGPLVATIAGLCIALPFYLVGSIAPKTTLRYRNIPAQGIVRSRNYGIRLVIVIGGLFVITSWLLINVIIINNQISNQIAIWSIAGLFLGLILGLGRALSFNIFLMGFLTMNAFVIGFFNIVLGGIALGFMIGLRFGLGTFIRHYTLRHMLANAGHLPRWRYDQFLDYAAQDLLILRKVGGGYRFTHDYLRQHLAASSSERSQG